MEKERHSYLKLRISGILKCPFGSCNRRSIPDVVGQQQRDPPADKPRQLIELFSPRIKSPNRIRLRSQIVKTVDQSVSMAKELVFPRRKDSSFPRNSSLLSADKKDPRPISPSPVSPIMQPRKKVSSRYPMRRLRKRKPTHLWKRCDFDKYYHEFYSSNEDEDEEEEENEKSALFSSRSDSSSLCGRNGSIRMRRKPKTAGIFAKQGKRIMGNYSKVKELGYAVTKRSKDPYSDFRDSMVEMIVERQLFGASDLEKLLKTFLSLNSSRHHGVITKVYTEIQQTLFSSGF